MVDVTEMSVCAKVLGNFCSLVMRARKVKK